MAPVVVNMGTAAVSTVLLRFSLCLWMCLFVACEQPSPEEEELYSTVKHSELQWTSFPVKGWSEVRMKLGSETANTVYQACSSNSDLRTLWSDWIPQKDGRTLFMDLTFTQEAEGTSQLSPLLVFFRESDRPVKRLSGDNDTLVHALRAPRPFSPTAKIPEGIEQSLNFSRGLPLGHLSRKGFHLGFAYSGPCVFIASVRLYSRRCPGFVESRAGFGSVVGGTGPVSGACVENSVEISPPQRECHANGLWGPLEGQCDCVPGHQEARELCVACRAGTYKPTNGSGACIPCPPNSKSDGEGAVECECMQGYSRVSGDPIEMGCTKPPSSPRKVRIHRQGGSWLELHWDAPVDLGGRAELWYDVRCAEREQDPGGRWEPCGDAVRFSPSRRGLNDTAVNVTGVDPRADYHLSVVAANAVSAVLSGADSANSITIDRWKYDVVHTSVPATIKGGPPSFWVVVGGACGGGLLLALAILGVCYKRRRYVKLSQDQEQPLMPMSTVVRYRRPEQRDITPAPQPISGQLPEGLSTRLQTSLKDMLVDRGSLTLGKPLGAGEFGSVYEGVFSPQEGGDVKVAVKTMKVGIHSLDDLESFLKEAEIMQGFDHDNVVKLLGVTLEQVQEQDSSVPMPMLILPFMKHGDLRRFLIATRYNDVPMFVPYQSLLRFMIDIAAGMEYLGSHSFVHRDLAARNCMLGDDLRVCVADFGLSRKIYSSDYYRQTAAVRVPIKWMSVESLSESIYSVKSDVWSFGVTMWEIASRGRTPYPGVHNHELLDLLESGHRLKQPECDPKLYEVMLSCWSRDPARRPGFGELGDTLRALLSELPPLEASEEVHYINQGLTAADQRAAEGGDPEFEEGATGNVYLPSPVAVPPSAEDEEGYLQYLKSQTHTN
ncbi:tyrosine-protein kinase receptor Tie-1 [Anguilla rostrata]|uniref:tyrosine-protein kinase receptor Tie-1 n=1 Tax=Anguilla rostrata TaxID=7938 RepID=UPI0030D2E6D1